ncbi:MAG: DUF3048 domain-containing protein [Candidatus Saccharimonadales bacterium]
MIDDFGSGHLHAPRKKSKIIHPLPKEEKTSVMDLAAAHEAAEQKESSETTDNIIEPISDLDFEFKTPDQVANDTPEPASEPDVDVETDEPNKPAIKTNPKKRHWPLNRLQTIIGIAAVIVLLSTGAATYALTRPSVKGGTFISKKGVYIPPKPTTVASKLTGLPVALEVNDRPVTGIMIENSLDARPQSGLDQAGVVFEAIAEGGITRFMALYQDSQPDYLGPVRSVRPYFLQWCMTFDCSLAHVGGSPEGLQDIKDWHSKDLDQFFNSDAYHRISSRYAPHNMYTSIAQLNQVEASKGYGASDFTSFPRKVDAPSKTPDAASVDLAMSGFYYNDHYDYDATTNTYKRSEGGQPHMQLNKDGPKTQITPKVVVAMVMQYGLESDDHHSQYNVVGNGQAFVFQDGTVTQGNWSKASPTSPIIFTDSAGTPIKFNAGQTWLTAMGSASQVSYK